MPNDKINYKQFKEKNKTYWEYFDYENQFVGFTYRSNSKDGKSKKILPGYVDKNNNVIFKAPKLEITLYGTKPLYNEHLLSKFPHAQVLIVEGEKTADFCLNQFPQYVTVSWLGGSSAAKHANISCLANRDVILWPDNDSPGFKAMDVLASRLHHFSNSVKIVKLPEFITTKGWDLADLSSEKIDKIESDFLSQECHKAIENAVDYSTQSEKNINFIHLNDKDKPLSTTKNLECLLKYYNIYCHYNEMTKQREFNAYDFNVYKNDSDNSILNIVEDLCILNGISRTYVNQQLTAICQLNSYHPVKDWILSKPLESPEIIYEFLKILPCENPEMSQHLLLTWMIQAMYVLFDNDFTQQGVLVLKGNQGVRKTSFVEHLCPIKQSSKLGHLLDVQSVDSIKQATESFITELGELDGTFRKSDIARLKSFITLSYDVYRIPYAKNSMRVPRQTVFIATVNEDRFLVDDTGNRRWWTISLIDNINLNHNLDMQQVWRAAYELYQAGAKPYLNDSELALLEESQQDMKMIDPIAELLMTSYDWNQPCFFWKTSTEICKELNIVINRANSTKIGSILKKMNIEKQKTKKGKVYKIPKHIL
jgi:putative DNA primase/helicase